MWEKTKRIVIGLGFMVGLAQAEINWVTTQGDFQNGQCKLVSNTIKTIIHPT